MRIYQCKYKGTTTINECKSCYHEQKKPKKMIDKPVTRAMCVNENCLQDGVIFKGVING